MKIAITGHTSGIGKSLYNKFIGNGHDIVGFSLDNGFDIAKSAVRDQIIELSKDVDVFVNNAWSPYWQTELLKQLIVHYKNQSKTIVNISSLAGLSDDTDSNVDRQNVHKRYSNYIHDKKTQNSICEYSMFTGDKCKILNVLPGFVDTPFSKSFGNPKLNPDQLADFLVYVVEHDHLFVHQLIVTVR